MLVSPIDVTEEFKVTEVCPREVGVEVATVGRDRAERSIEPSLPSLKAA
jgi:hypothetical protein